MRILNPNHLPESLVRAVTPQDREIDFSRMSVTDLIGPPRIRILKLQNWHRMEERVEDRVWLMLGSAFHELMDRLALQYNEEKIAIQIDEFTLVGVPDIYEEGILYDYKVTSLWSYIHGVKDDWVSQLQIYRWMLAPKVEINKIRVIAILRDWIKSKSFEADYPDMALKIIDIPLWSTEKVEKYIKDRLQAHRDNLPCTEEERWMSKTRYAVKVGENKKAARVLDTREEAEAWASDKYVGKKKKAWTIEERPGEYSRCKLFCNVAAYCPDNIYREDSNV